MEEIRSAILRLSARPLIGHVRRDLAPPRYRFWPIYSYLIIYRPDTSPLEIVRVWHGAQDKPRLSKSKRLITRPKRPCRLPG